MTETETKTEAKTVAEKETINKFNKYFYNILGEHVGLLALKIAKENCTECLRIDDLYDPRNHSCVLPKDFNIKKGIQKKVIQS